jgi:phosphomannomutase
LVDGAGRYIGEEYTLALCVQRAMAHAETRGPVVINGATSGMSESLAQQAGVASFRSAVGEANVADLMIDQKATYGGEGNGGPIDPRVGYVRDSFVGMAQVLDLMTSSGKSLAELADALPKFHIVKSVAQVTAEQLPVLLDRLVDAHPEADATTGDGLRLAWQDKWLLVRGSNTEPIVRLIAEAQTQDEAQDLCDRAAALI